MFSAIAVNTVFLCNVRDDSSEDEPGEMERLRSSCGEHTRDSKFSLPSSSPEDGECDPCGEQPVDACAEPVDACGEAVMEPCGECGEVITATEGACGCCADAGDAMEMEGFAETETESNQEGAPEQASQGKPIMRIDGAESLSGPSFLQRINNWLRS